MEKSTRNGIEKGVVWLHLGQLYWDREEFVKAQPCYAGVLSLFDKDREDYKEVNDRSKILDELYPHAFAVELQDSLQLLAQMDSVERMKVIKNIIEELKKKEKEEEKKAAEAAAAARNPQGGQTPGGQYPGMNNQTPAEWYFYNPAVVMNGKNEFQRLWGERQLTDDWRRNNKTVLAMDEDEEDEEIEEIMRQLARS